MTSTSISLPQLPDVDQLTDRVAGLATDLAAAARERAGDLADVAAELLDDVPDRAVTLAAAAIPTLRPAPRRSRAPFLLLALVVAAAVGGIWWWRRREADSLEPA